MYDLGKAIETGLMAMFLALISKLKLMCLTVHILIHGGVPPMD